MSVFSSQENDWVLKTIQSEGLNITNIPTGVSKGNDLINTSIYLFRFIPEDGDARWHLATNYLKARQKNWFDHIHFENALLATYLSQEPSYRNRYSSYQAEQNIRHLCRAISNLDTYSFFKDRIGSIKSEQKDTRFEFARTNRINLGTDRFGITGCPEALYQERLFYRNIYIARIGFNSHFENGTRVISIANLQGIPNGKQIQSEFEDYTGINPFNMLIRKCKYILNDCIIRGLKNPKNTESDCLYNATFKCEGIERFSFKRS